MISRTKILPFYLYWALSIVVPTLARADAPSFLNCPRDIAPTIEPVEWTPICRGLPQIDWARCANYCLDEIRQLDPELTVAPREVKIIESTEPNAFLLNENSIAITTALLESVEHKADLSFIIAHEIGHSAINQIRGISAHRAQFAQNHADLLADELSADFYANWIAQLQTAPPSKLLEKLSSSTNRNSTEFPVLNANLEKRIENLKRLSAHERLK